MCPRDEDAAPLARDLAGERRIKLPEGVRRHIVRILAGHVLVGAMNIGIDVVTQHERQAVKNLRGRLAHAALLQLPPSTVRGSVM